MWDESDHCKHCPLQHWDDTDDFFTTTSCFPFYSKYLIWTLNNRISTLCRYLAAAEALCASGTVKIVSLLICTASAFSERYLGMPLRDDSRYQVRVYCFHEHVSCWSLKTLTSVTHLQLSSCSYCKQLISKSEAAMLCFTFSFFSFLMLCRILSLICLWLLWTPVCQITCWSLGGFFQPQRDCRSQASWCSAIRCTFLPVW